MPTSSVFRDIFVAASLEQAIIDLLQEWFPDYLREIESQLSMPLGQIIPPKQYTNRNSFDSLPGEQNPRCVVISPGLVGQPTVTNNGQFRAAWGVGIGVAVAHKSEVTANLLSKIYGAAARAIVLHHSRELGNVWNVQWRDENYDDLPLRSQAQFYKGAAVYFVIEMENVVTKSGGPDAPDPTYALPWNWPQVEASLIDVQIVKEVL